MRTLRNFVSIFGVGPKPKQNQGNLKVWSFQCKRTSFGASDPGELGNKYLSDLLAYVMYFLKQFVQNEETFHFQMSIWVV